MDKINKITRINGSKVWDNLKNKIIHNEVIEIKDCYNDAFIKGPIFKKAETIFMTECDKNFVYYWLDKRTFPNVQRIFLNSHPCEMPVLHRFNDALLYLNENERGYKERWARTNINVNLLENKIMKILFDKLPNDDIIITEQK